MRVLYALTPNTPPPPQNTGENKFAKVNHQYLQQEESNFGFKTHLGKLPSLISLLIK